MSAPPVGLPIRDLVTPEEVQWDRLAGRTLAVDGYNAIYQFLATIRQPDGRLFTDAEGRVTSHLIGLLYRTASLLEQGVRPVWVFDGPPPELKSGTLRARFRVKEKAEAQWQEALAAGDLETARRKAAQTSRLTDEMEKESLDVLDALGVPHVAAPSEGEAQAAHMAAKGQVWASASEDYDSLLFRTPRLVRGLAARQKRARESAAQLVDRAALMERLGVDDDELILIGVLVGSDYNDGAKGYGPKRALKLAQEHLGTEAALRKAGLDLAELAPVLELFRHPSVADVPNPRFAPAQEDQLLAILVDRHGFSADRVRAALRRSQKPPPKPTPEPPKGRQASLDAFPETAEDGP